MGGLGFSEFEEFGLYRCEVTEVSGDDVTVFYVDYGNYETKKKTEVFIIPEDGSAVIRRLCVQCRLSGTSPTEGGDWSEEAAVWWKEKMDSDEEIKAIFVSRDPNNVYAVQLKINDEDAGAVLIEKGFGKAVPLGNFFSLPPRDIPLHSFIVF